MDPVWEKLSEYLKDSPLVLLCALWIADLRRQIAVKDKRIAELEDLMRSLNDKIREDIVPLLTRLMDLVPDLISQVRHRK